MSRDAESRARARLTRQVVELAVVVAILALVFRPLAVVVAVIGAIRLVRRSLRDVLEPALHEHWTRTEYERRRPEPRSAPPAVRARRAETERRARTLSSQVARELRDPVRNARDLVRRMGEDPGAPQALGHAREALAELDRVERSIAHLLRTARQERAPEGSP